MKKNYRQFVSFQLKRLGKHLALFTVMGLAINGTYSPVYGLSPGEPAIQLLHDRALFVLRDSFRAVGTHYSANPKSHLTIFNKTMKTLKIELTGKNGTFPLVLRPKSEYSWRIFPGTYHFEAGIPGFPTMAGEIPLSAQTQYTWQIWRGELENAQTIPDPVPVITSQPQVVIIEKAIKYVIIEDCEPLITNH